jgi:hypothetical protein
MGEALALIPRKDQYRKGWADKIDDDIRRITRYEDWCNLVEDPESGDEGSVSHGPSNQARGTIIVRPHIHSA